MGRLLDLALNGETEAAAATAWRWLLHFAEREPLEVFFIPEATHGEVLAANPEALAAEPLGRSSGNRPHQ